MSSTAKLFMHGRSQAVRLPKAFRFAGNEVLVRKEGDRVILEPKQRPPRTREEIEAMFKRIDELRGDELFDYPPEPGEDVDDWTL